MTTNAPNPIHFMADGPDPLHPFVSYPIPSPPPPPKKPMNNDKLIGAIESLCVSVFKQCRESPSESLPDEFYYKELGKTAYALEILPQLNLLKSYLTESDVIKELRRSFRNANGRLVEEFIETNGGDSQIVVYLDNVKVTRPFNELMDELTLKD